MIGRAKISGTGMSVPDLVVTNEELAARMDTSDEWIRQRTGIQERRWISHDDETPASLAQAAAQQALEQAALEISDIDIILLATNTSQFIYPAGAGRIQNAFGKDGKGRIRMRNATALDLQQGCASFLGGIVLAHGMIRGDIFPNVLVVGADVSTRMLDIHSLRRIDCA